MEYCLWFRIVVFVLCRFFTVLRVISYGTKSPTNPAHLLCCITAAKEHTFVHARDEKK